MTLERAKKILEAHGYKENEKDDFSFEVVGSGIIAKTPYTSKDGAGIETNIITFESGKTYVNGQRESIAAWLGY